MTQSLPIRLDRADGMATLTLCRPEQKNVVTPEFIAALQAHAERYLAEPPEADAGDEKLD